MSIPTLRYGQTGQDVKTLQMALNTLGYGLTEDGVFGSNTLSAVQNYQNSHGLTVDGIAGDQTWGSLLLEVSKQPNSSVTASLLSTSSSLATSSTPIPNLSSPSPSPSAASINWTKWGMILFVALGAFYFLQDKQGR